VMVFFISLPSKSILDGVEFSGRQDAGHA
jgi:hypothetical protein